MRAALDEVGRDVLAGGSLREALRDLMRRGFDGSRGLDDLADRVRRMRDAARRRGDLGGTLDQVRAALDQALAAERDTLAGEDSDDARLAEMDLATIPDDTAGAVRALASYDWHSHEARATYESIKQMLQREVLDAQFAGLKRALDDPDPEAMQAVKDMLADLNALLAAHARGEDTEDRFREFMDKHGDLFPENPQNVDELIDALARRQAAADRMMASLSPEQREQLGQLMSDAMSDPDLASQMAQLSDNLRALRPGLDRGPVEHARRRRADGLQRRRRGGRRARRPRGARAVAGADSPRRDAGRRRRRHAWSSTSAPRPPRPPGAARAGARARAAGLRLPRRRRPAAHPARRAAARARRR